MAATTKTDVASVLKDIYPNGISELVIAEANDPFIGLVEKAADFYGKKVVHSWQVNTGNGHSAQFTNAQSGVTAPKFEEPYINQATLYAVQQIETQALLNATRGGGLTNLVTNAQQNNAYNIGRFLSKFAWGNGGGALGKLGSGTVGGTTLTLADPNEAQYFSPGMVVAASDTDGTSGSLRSGTVTLSAVNYETGVLTATGNWTAGISAIANTDYLFRVGDFGKGIFGVRGWIPSSDPTTTDGTGIDRSKYPQLLAGVRYNCSITSPMDAVGAIIGNHSKYSAKHDTLFLPSADYGALLSDATTLQRIDTKALIGYDSHRMAQVKAAELSFGGVVINGQRGPVSVYSAPAMPKGTYLLTQMASWKLRFMEELAFNPIDVPGGPGTGSIALASADGIELRAAFMGNLFCSTPLNSQTGTIAWT